MRRLLLVAAAITAGCSEDAKSENPAVEDSSIEVATIDSSTNNETAVDSAVEDASDTPSVECVLPTGSGTEPTDRYTDGADVARVTVSGTACKRTFVLSSTATLRDSLPSNPRTINEDDDRPHLRTKNDVFDALYALAQAEAKEDSVAAISDGAFNSGSPITCPTGGCFETGRLWKYVWTRDTSFSVDLGLASIDPTRALNSLEFKVSERRGGGLPEIVQDTGSGGSWPVSTDRVVWAMGASRLSPWLGSSERTAFRSKALAAMKNTIERDRQVIFDPSDGLYRGEQSFLDWREQSYPSWTATDTVHLGMSKALSTNVAHLAILRTASRWASDAGDAANATTWATWASQLSIAIKSKLWLASDKQLSTFITTTLDPAPVHRFDALGTALAVLNEVVTGSDAKDAIASYPHLMRGVPVIWPQQKETPIYHNRAIWPFVTAYFAKAARVVRNDAVVDNAVASLMRGAALNLSNMENLEMVSGKPYVADGAYSGPVVNSQRQLWSVAGYVSMVQDVIFGMETSDAGIRFQPYVTKKLRNTLFANADSIVLEGVRFRGKKLTVVVKLPPKGGDGGAYTAPAAAFAEPASDSVIEIALADSGEAAASMKFVSDTSDYKNLFGPRSPSVTAIDASSGNLKLTWDASGESLSEVAFNVYRDGVRVASGLTTATWTDTTATATSPSYCYAIEAYFTGSNNHSQHSPPSCWWGNGSVRVKTIGASSFTNVGGTGVTNYGKFHYESWGDPSHTLSATFTPTSTGEHLLQVNAGNGAGAINTGITAGLKVVEVLDGTTVVARGHFLMPHLGAWSAWRDSSFIRANLTAGKAYNVVIKHNDTSMYMSFFAHFEQYTGGSGGKDGAFSRVNIAELKVLARVN